MLTVVFDNNKKQPLYQQLYSFIRQEIEDGKIIPGEKLPSKRRLAAHLKISQNTVETAYNQLCAEGYLCSVPKSGFYAENIGIGSVFGDKNNKDIQEISLQENNEPYDIDFRTNIVDTAHFPFSIWAKLTRETLTLDKRYLLESTPPQGDEELRTEIAAYLHAYRGIEANAEQIIVGAGSEYLLGIIIQLLGKNKLYALENPGYAKIAKILQAQQANISFIPLDDDGMQIEYLRSSGADIAHVTPSHHFPLGIVYPVSRRRELLSWADEKEERYIIEDDYDSEFRYIGRPIPALGSLDRNGRVIYMNTFAKTLAPSLRISYMVLPPKILQLYKENLLFYSSTVPIFDQHILRRFMAEGYLERHLARMRNLYKSRRNIFLEEIEKSSLAHIIKVRGTECGMHLLIGVEGCTEKALTDAALKAGLKVYGLSSYYANVKTDYPHIISIGERAEEDFLSIYKGSKVLVDGMIATRKIRKVGCVCAHCNEKYDWEEKVTEIISYGTEYLSDFKTIEGSIEEEKERRRREKEAAALQAISG